MSYIIRCKVSFGEMVLFSGHYVVHLAAVFVSCTHVDIVLAASVCASVCPRKISKLLVQYVKLSTVGGQAFPVAGPTIWNSLPDNVTSAPSLFIFGQRLKTFLFQASFPNIVIDPVKSFPHL